MSLRLGKMPRTRERSPLNSSLGGLTLARSLLATEYMAMYIKEQLKVIWVVNEDANGRGGRGNRAHGGAKSVIHTLRKKADVSLEIVHHQASEKNAVVDLVAYAKKAKVDLIICETHGRSGLSRLIQGSFAESLVLASPAPVIVCNPHCRTVTSLKDILFITDFSRQSHEVFLRILDFARLLNARIKIFHAITAPSQPVLQTGASLLGAGWVPLEAYYGAESKEQKELAEIWAAAARKVGVRAEASVAARATSVTTEVERAVRREKPALVACAVESTGAEAAFFGSVTRNLMRRLNTPVMVTRS